MTWEEILTHVGRSLLYSGPDMLIWCTAALMAVVLLSRKPLVGGILALTALMRLGIWGFSQAGWYISTTAFMSGSNFDPDGYRAALLARSMVSNTAYALLFALVVVAVFTFRGDPEPELPPEA